MGNAYRVLLLVYGVGLVMVAARSDSGSQRSVGSLSEQHEYICSLLPNCTSWCSDCGQRSAHNLFDQLESCLDWTNAPALGYQYVYRCQPLRSSYVACVCTYDDLECKKCQYTKKNNLVCFAQESGDVQVWSRNATSNRMLENVCPSCLCSTNRPTVPRPPTTPIPLPTIQFDDKIEPKPSQRTLTTDAGNTDGGDVIVIIAASVCGGILLIASIVGCICYQKNCWKKNQQNGQQQEYDYINTTEMQALRSQASVMASQQFMPCGNRSISNELYGLNKVGNGSTLPAQPPALPGNHPPPAGSPPAMYQQLNRGQVAAAGLSPAAAAAAACGQCPRCGQTAADRSATTPLPDRPVAGADTFPTAADAAKSPYMALIKTNTCPTPGTPSTEPVCQCHARPLSECSSAGGSVLSEPRGGRTVGTLGSASQGSDQRPLSGASDAQESPYYFKVDRAEDKAPVTSPKSNQYFKLEDAETLPVEAQPSEVSPMLSQADDNGNNVVVKPDLSHQPSEPGKGGYKSLPNSSIGKLDGVPPSSGERAQTLGGTVVREPGLEETTPIGRGSMSGNAEGLPNGDYMQLIDGKKTNDRVRGVALESTV